jgi:hypothetical protein
MSVRSFSLNFIYLSINVGKESPQAEDREELK